MYTPDPRIDKLVSIADHALGIQPVDLSLRLRQLAGRNANELVMLLSKKNGFFAFEGALHVFPSGTGQDPMSMEEWNDDELWRFIYGDRADGLLFFAEDAFGVQFGLNPRDVYKFEPESGDSEFMASNLEEWAKRILNKYEIETGYHFAHEWQKHNGPLPLNKRLLPKTPFVLGGEFVVENLYAFDAVEGMRLRGELANQLRDLPDGTTIKLQIVE